MTRRKPIDALTLERYVKRYPLDLTSGLWSVATEMQPYPRTMPDAVMAVNCATLYSKKDALAVLDRLLAERMAVGVGHWGGFVISEVQA